MQTRFFYVDGAPSILVGTRQEIVTRTTFDSAAKAGAFVDRIRARGFSPRLSEVDGVWTVTLHTTPEEVSRLLAGKR